MEVLRRFWLFADLDERELFALGAVASVELVPEGHLLFRLGDPTPGLHLIETGAAKIYRLTADGAERILDIIGPGEFCGEMGVVDAAPSGAWGQTLVESRIWVIPPTAFEQVLLSQPRIALKVCRVLVSKLRTASRQMEETLFLPARQRVIRHLTRLAERFGRPSGSGVVIPFRLTHQEIAQLSGTSRETASRVMADLTRRGALRSGADQMAVADLQALRHLAGE